MIKSSNNITIGIEVHAQLLTQTKLFCGCPIDWQAPPNTLTCPVCLGMPGTLPVVNKKAVELAVKAALALNCKVAEKSVFARKNYFYPDLPKGYQITQYEYPLASDGFMEVNNKKIRIRRVHIEEDAGKLLHEADKSLVDFNRCGVPLIEIVTEPDITSAQEAHDYLVKLRQVLRYLEVCTGDMEKGHLRCEPNISINRGTRTEIKNLNSFKAVEKGIDYEVERQIKLLQANKKVEHITLLWDEKTQQTHEMRGKEEAEDYRYFPEPDLPPLMVSQQWAEEIAKTLPELPDAKIKRFVATYSIREYDARTLTQERQLADYYEEVLKHHPDSKLVASFVTEELLKLLHQKQIEIDDLNVSSRHLAELFQFIQDGTITRKIAKEVFPEMAETGKEASEIIEAKGLKQISEKSELESVVKEVLQEHPDEVKRYKAGKEGLFGFFVGEVMRKTRGKANPQIVNEILTQLLQ